MSKNMEYPYEFISIFLKSININRKDEIPPNTPIIGNVKFKVIEPEFPKLQINVLFETVGDLPITYAIEALGLFKYIGSKKVYDKELNKKFVFEKGLHIISAYVSQMIKLFTSQMGMNPLNVPITMLLDEIVEKVPKK
jgi:hypothetical protein